ncbi:medium-chain acyl-CoA ligase ACSF2, mitochondrial-like [Glandiceps talaboti]
MKTVVPGQSVSASVLADILKTESVTVACLMYQQLVGIMQEKQISDRDHTALRLLFTTGNIVSPEVLNKVRQYLTPHVYTLYGSSEAGGVTCNRNLLKSDKIGYPICHQEIKIVDEGGAIVPLNTAGELCIRSPYIMLRYEKDEEQSKAAIDAAGWYHTGDVCQMEDDGCLDIIGRKNDIIIKGGINIYPIEVERVLLRHPKVKITHVVSIPDELLVEDICACICLEDGQELTVREILEFVRPLLPEYLVPRHVLFFDSFPMSPVGKMQRNELAHRAGKLILEECR